MRAHPAHPIEDESTRSLTRDMMAYYKRDRVARTLIERQIIEPLDLRPQIGIRFALALASKQKDRRLPYPVQDVVAELKRRRETNA